MSQNEFSVSAKRMVSVILNRHPFEVFVISVLLIVGALAELFGIATLMPALEKVMNEQGQTLSLGDDVISQFMEEIFSHYDSLTIFAIAISVMMAKTLLVFIAYSYIAKIGVQIEKGYRNDIMSSILQSRWGYASTINGGQALNIINNESGKIFAGFNNFGIFYSELLISTIFISTSIVVSYESLLIVIVFSIPIFLFIKSINKKTNKNSQERHLLLNKMHQHTINFLSLFKFIKSESSETSYVGEFNDVSGQLAEKHYRDAKYKNLIRFFPEAASLIIAAVVFILGPALLETSHATAILFTLICYRASGRIISLLQARRIMHAAAPSILACHDLMEQAQSMKEEIKSDQQLSFEKNIHFKNIHFKYEKDSNLILKGLDLTFTKKQVTALVGPSGSGKTTIVDLLLALMEPTQGCIDIDGQNLTNSDFRSWRHKISYVSQDPHLINGTIRSNIIMHRENVTDAQLEDALRTSYVYEFLEKLPDGLDTEVGDRGVKLSGGQRQRIAIARALVSNPELLILDEATSALDNETERYIQRSMEELSKRTTLIIIAHRLSTIRNADCIYVLSNGVSVENGTYDALLEKKGMLYKLEKSGDLQELLDEN